ncbi:hypothetical protein Hypma_009797 [Hypsizygus marmoreus]|uniref:Arrestin C-terminal-like domain-containing protein n=1 Tax=Hypsizygus marmoreus TaxID=39966 RepID=A0A369JRD5_HYPMA|nr:hypothetical protein Hypma_009797 [Hypsizygus marmoreus]
MSQVKLTLRPPPNVDFVHGYPGIPPGGPDRPQAAVKGAIEVRVGPQGVKAKWVRIELRKVETLPGGGMSNTFYDYVGPSPVNLWTSSDEYGLLRTQDFPFSIRIPESIPPSIALENKAGIQYELVASLCTKGKRSFLRKRKSTVVSTQAAIIIDKHDLHSTWPVYCQHETRQHVQDGGTLIVDRNQTCYGPGDRISVVATFRSDALEGPVLRGFELTLRESMIFRAGPHGKKAAPQAKTTIISDSKLAINGALHIGAQHRAELTCMLSPNHTTTTLNAARHIDITYTLSVKAIVDGLTPIVLDLPVIISNWQRNVSQEAIRRIGPAPNLSLMPTPIAHQIISRTEPPPARAAAAATLPISRDNYGVRQSPIKTYSTLPSSSQGGGGGTFSKPDEFGYGVGYGGARPAHGHSSSAGSNTQYSDEARSTANVAPVLGTGVGMRPSSAHAATNRFTITNAQPSEIPQQQQAPEARQRTGSAGRETGGGGGGGTMTGRGPWPTAEDEKQRLYEAARAKVERVQGSVGRVTTPPPQVEPPATQTPLPRTGPWLTAEEEKLRLFNQAQAAAKKSQGIESYSPPSSLHGKSDGAVDLSRTPSTSKTPPTLKSKNSPAALYSQAMAARDAAAARQQQQAPVTPPTTPPARTSPTKIPVPQYLTAEQEKAALRRYEEAKRAVDRVQYEMPAEDAGQIQAANGPIAYEHLYPENTNNGVASSSTPGRESADLPPPFDMAPHANAIPASHLSEKEKLRRAYEMQDAAALARQNNVPKSSPPPFSSTPTPAHTHNQGLSEKEILRRKFESQDAEALNAASLGRVSPPQPPPRGAPIPTRSPSSGGGRPPPTPPTSPGKILTAAEEKALLRAQYAAQDARAAKQQQQKVNGNGKVSPPPRPSSSAAHTHTPSPPTPPPLMPRPPVEYIQETQEEDARVSRIAMNGTLPVDTDAAVRHHAPLSPIRPVVGVGSGMGTLDMRPFTPFVAGFENAIPPPPPLPPKPAGE